MSSTLPNVARRTSMRRVFNAFSSSVRSPHAAPHSTDASTSGQDGAHARHAPQYPETLLAGCISVVFGDSSAHPQIRARKTLNVPYATPRYCSPDAFLSCLGIPAPRRRRHAHLESVAQQVTVNAMSYALPRHARRTHFCCFWAILGHHMESRMRGGAARILCPLFSGCATQRLNIPAHRPSTDLKPLSFPNPIPHLPDPLLSGRTCVASSQCRRHKTHFTILGFESQQVKMGIQASTPIGHVARSLPSRGIYLCRVFVITVEPVRRGNSIRRDFAAQGENHQKVYPRPEFAPQKHSTPVVDDIRALTLTYPITA
ncbi:hypothetical protein DFP72DRAFT_847720 [Ephemerocybe angulata]|uniref:Uncharacterized protein n=1 Tax=Ephemerocybe angulata TaxID=980116 RepID=A0A8H6M580_9AGAR|nr:hypothetical protein DFP72DRAFT_847720 [Tulosesus angulatus]